nr:RGG repeats nuclear RNA binding protein A-like isoform X2 [Ipomoea batatas]
MPTRILRQMRQKKKEPEEKEMTLEEYEKVLEEKRKALLASNPEERKVCLDKEFASMQLLSNKKNDEEVFIKLGGSEKEKKKEAGEKVKKFGYPMKSNLLNQTRSNNELKRSSDLTMGNFNFPSNTLFNFIKFLKF